MSPIPPEVLAAFAIISALSALLLSLACVYIARSIRGSESLGRTERHMRWERLSQIVIVEFLPDELEEAASDYLDGEIPEDDFLSLLAAYQSVDESPETHKKSFEKPE